MQAFPHHIFQCTPATYLEFSPSFRSQISAGGRICAPDRPVRWRMDFRLLFHIRHHPYQTGRFLRVSEIYRWVISEKLVLRTTLSINNILLLQRKSWKLRKNLLVVYLLRTVANSFRSRHYAPSHEKLLHVWKVLYILRWRSQFPENLVLTGVTVSDKFCTFAFVCSNYECNLESKGYLFSTHTTPLIFIYFHYTCNYWIFGPLFQPGEHYFLYRRNVLYIEMFF